MFPGLMRTAATPASIAFSASDALKWMSAITGSGDSRTILGRAAASSFFGTATRTISQPADASAAICAVVASTSCVFVSVIDCTATGAPPPTGTLPTVMARSLAISAASLTAAYLPVRVSTGRFRRTSSRARHPEVGIASDALAAREPADVAGEADEEDEQHERDPDRGDALVDRTADRPAPHALDDRERDVAAVQRQ